jgi:transcriptional regulator with XRE-family HTH domain
LKVQICTQVLKKYLSTKNISQNQLAKKIGISREHLNRIVHGKCKRPNNRVIAGLLHLTNIPFEELFVVVPDPQPTAVAENLSSYSSDLSSEKIILSNN